MDSLMESALNAAALRPDGIQREDEAFQQGRDACIDGYSDDVCPYRRSDNSVLHDAWIDGWECEFEKHGREVENDARDIRVLQRRT